MKIEKLTHNKIKVIINSSEINYSNIESFLSSSFKEQQIFLDILSKAEKEFDFNVDGCKLLIEGFQNTNNQLVFTITKYDFLDVPKYVENICDRTAYTSKKSFIPKRKTFNTYSKNLICIFDTFDNFCDFSSFILNFSTFDIKSFSNDISLYEYSNKFYLIIKDIYENITKFNIFTSNISEFSKLKNYSVFFESKILEHGKMILKKAI